MILIIKFKKEKTRISNHLKLQYQFYVTRKQASNKELNYLK